MTDLPQVLVMIPIESEMKGFLAGCASLGCRTEAATVGRLAVVRLPVLGLTVAPGGLGKVQFGLQTQHLLDAGPGWARVICAGAAGALVDELAVGDIVAATETVEHDIYNKFGKPILPRFGTEPASLAAIGQIAEAAGPFRVHFGPVASGDEDVIDLPRKAAIRQLTGALAVAWEEAGGARACQFSGVPFIELRGISDAANSTAAMDFVANLPQVMANLAALIIAWAKTDLSE